MSHLDVHPEAVGLRIAMRGLPRGLPLPVGTMVTFHHGIPGFAGFAHWRFSADPTVRPFLYMCSADDSVRFVCVEPFRICQDYELTVPTVEATQLGITADANLAVLAIVTVTERPEEMTANLMSPLVINLDRRRGQQLILERSPYPLKYSIWDNLRLGQEEDVEQLAAV